MVVTAAALLSSHLAVSCYLYLFASSTLAILLVYFFFKSSCSAWCFACDEAAPEAHLQTLSPAATPPISHLGLSSVLSTFTLTGNGQPSEPHRPPLYRHLKKLPHDLTSRGYAAAATADAHLAVKLLNLPSQDLHNRLNEWHRARGTCDIWRNLTRDLKVVARRSTLTTLWGYNSGSQIRVRRSGGILYLDPAYKIVHSKNQASFGRRLEVALTRTPGTRLSTQRTHLAEAFFAAVKVDLQASTLLLTEIDCVQQDSVLVNGKSGDCHIIELKCRTCVPKSKEFSRCCAKSTWAQCFLGAVGEAVIAVRGGSRLVSLHHMSQDALITAAQREDPDWTPKHAVAALNRRLGWVDSCVREGADLLLTEKRDTVTGEARFRLLERHSAIEVALSETLA